MTSNWISSRISYSATNLQYPEQRKEFTFDIQQSNLLILVLSTLCPPSEDLDFKGFDQEAQIDACDPQAGSNWTKQRDEPSLYEKYTSNQLGLATAIIAGSWSAPGRSSAANPTRLRNGHKLPHTTELGPI